MLASEIHVPRPGFYRIRMVRGGPWVPAKIEDVTERDPDTGELMEDQQFLCVVNGIERDAWKWAERINLYGEAISERDFKYLSRVSEWAKEHAPDEPEAAPTQRIDLNRIAPIKP